MKRFHSQGGGPGGGPPARGFSPGIPGGMERMGSPHMGGQPPFDGAQVGSLMGMPAAMGPPDAAAAQKHGFDPRAMVGAMGPLDAAEYFAGQAGAAEMSRHHPSHQGMHSPATNRGGAGGAGDAGKAAGPQHAGLNGQTQKRQRMAAGPGAQGLLPGMPMEGAHQDALMELARENLLLKHQLHVATLEMGRLSAVLNGFQQQAPQDEPKAKQKGAQSRYWTEAEHQRFLEAVQNFGHKDVKAIANIVGTRSATQVRTHAQKYFMKMARFKKQDESGKGGGRNANANTNPDAAPSEAAEDDNCTGTAAAAAAAAGEAGTSAAAAAAFVAASHSKTGAVEGKSRGKAAPPLENTTSKKTTAGKADQHREPPVRVSSKKNPGSPGSMDSGRSGGSSDGTSNGRSNGTTSNDNTNGNGSSSSNNSNRNGNEGSCSDSGRGDSNNGVSSNEGSDHGFFDTGAEEEAFVDDLQFQNGDDNAKTGFEFAEAEAEPTAT